MNPLKILRNIMKKIVLLLMCFLAILNKTQAQYLNAQTYEFSIETIKSVSIANENNSKMLVLSISNGCNLYLEKRNNNEYLKLYSPIHGHYPKVKVSQRIFEDIENNDYQKYLIIFDAKYSFGVLSGFEFDIVQINYFNPKIFKVKDIGYKNNGYYNIIITSEKNRADTLIINPKKEFGLNSIKKGDNLVLLDYMLIKQYHKITNENVLKLKKMLKNLP